MKVGFLLFAITAWTLMLYSYIDEQNGLLALRRSLPKLAEEVRLLEEEVQRQEYLLAQAFSPQKLFEFLRQPEFGHLHFPKSDEVLEVSAELL